MASTGNEDLKDVIDSRSQNGWMVEKDIPPLLYVFYVLLILMMINFTLLLRVLFLLGANDSF